MKKNVVIWLVIVALTIVLTGCSGESTGFKPDDFQKEYESWEESVLEQEEKKQELIDSLAGDYYYSDDGSELGVRCIVHVKTINFPEGHYIAGIIDEDLEKITTKVYGKDEERRLANRFSDVNQHRIAAGDGYTYSEDCFYIDLDGNSHYIGPDTTRAFSLVMGLAYGLFDTPEAEFVISNTLDYRIPPREQLTDPVEVEYYTPPGLMPESQVTVGHGSSGETHYFIGLEYKGEGKVESRFIDESEFDFIDYYQQDLVPKKYRKEVDEVGYVINPEDNSGTTENATADIINYLEYTEYADYVLEDADSGIFDAEYYTDFSDEMLKIARNEILARHGRKFNDPSLQAYFDNMYWYEPLYEPEEFDAQMESLLNQFELENLAIIQQVERERK